jgi:DNA modification methylase
VILDPFAGEGTFLRPSIRNGKAYAGWEIDPERFEEMRKKMPDDEKFPCGSIQLDLFQ